MQAVIYTCAVWFIQLEDSCIFVNLAPFSNSSKIDSWMIRLGNKAACTGQTDKMMALITCIPIHRQLREQLKKREENKDKQIVFKIWNWISPLPWVLNTTAFLNPVMCSFQTRAYFPSTTPIKKYHSICLAYSVVFQNGNTYFQKIFVEQTLSLILWSSRRD